MHPILFEIGPVTIRSYGVLVALAFLVGFYLSYKEAGRRNFYPGKILDMQICIIIFGVIGARILHVAVNLEYYKNHIFEILFIWRGGLAIYGGVLFGAIACWIYVIKNKMPFFRTADLFAPYVALGQSIGRIGCFLNGCCFGKPPHLTQVYASLSLLGIFVVLRLGEKLQPRVGSLFGLYLLLYSVQRFFVDFLRADMPRYILGLTASQLISALVFLAGIAFLTHGKDKISR